jgi:mannose-6-phosphate isomerase-like protein (cupin superfamily)
VSGVEGAGLGSMESNPGNGERQLDFHPGIPMRWEITRTPTDTNGELFEATNWLDAHMPGPPVHVHPTAEESYQVLEGTLDVLVDGKWRSVTAGETVTVSPGVPHTLRNASDHPTRIVNVHRPALQFEQFFRQLQDLIASGKIKRLPPKEPRSAIYAAMLFGKYPQEIITKKPPNGLFKALALLGRGLGFKLES